MESLLTSFRNFSNSASKSISFFLKRSRKFSHRSDISEPEVDLAFSNVRNTLCKENTMRSVPHKHLPPSFQSEICQQLRNQASNLTTGLPGCVFARRQSFTSFMFFSSVTLFPGYITNQWNPGYPELFILYFQSQLHDLYL